MPNAPAEPTEITTIQFLTEGGGYRQPIDSTMGDLYRPFAGAQQGGRVSTLETLYEFWINNVPDPDEALRLDPNIRQKLRMHPDVVSAMRKRELTVASFPERIEPNPDGTDKTVARNVAEYVGWVWRQIPKTQLLYQQMQGAVMDGGRGHEWMWHREVNGVERPVQFFAVDKTRFVFDRIGNMALRTRTEPVWGAYVMGNPQSQITGKYPRGKFTYHMHRQEPGSWEDPQLEGYMYYGVGEDVSLYYLVTFDTFVLRFRMKWLQMYGLPPTDIYYPWNMPEFQGVLQQLVDQCHQQTITTIPRMMGQATDSMVKVDYRNVPAMSYDAFQTFSDDYTKPRIDNILLGSAEEGQKADDGGGYSQHVARQDTGPNVWFRWDAKNIGGTLTSQLLPAIALARFPNLPMEYYPILKLESKEERDRGQEAEILEIGSKMIPVSEDEAYERLGFRKPKQDEKTIFTGGQQGTDPFDQPPPNIPGLMGGSPDNLQTLREKRLQAAKNAPNPGFKPRMRPAGPIGTGRGRTQLGNLVGMGRQ